MAVARQQRVRFRRAVAAGGVTRQLRDELHCPSFLDRCDQSLLRFHAVVAVEQGGIAAHYVQQQSGIGRRGQPVQVR